MSEDFDSSDAPRERAPYSSLSDDYRGFDVREEEEGGRSYLVVGLALGVVLVFGTVVWNAYRVGVKDDVNDTPVIKADAGDFKKRPDDRGGMETPNQDKRLFDAIDNNDRSETSAPVEKVSDGKPTDLRPKPAVQTQVSPSESSPSAPETTAPAPVEPPEVQRPATPPPSLPPTPPPQPVEPSLPMMQFDQSGNYLVQLSALRDVAGAERAWSQMVEAYPELFSGAVMDIQRADLGSKGIYYRVRASAFASRAAADKFCDALKSRGEACIVTARS